MVAASQGYHTFDNSAGVVSDTYYHYVDMDDFKHVGLQLEIGSSSDSVTVTVEGTIDNSTTADASKSWQDMTLALFGVASITATGMFVHRRPLPIHKLRIKVVTAGGNDDGNYVVYAKKVN